MNQRHGENDVIKDNLYKYNSDDKDVYAMLDHHHSGYTDLHYKLSFALVIAGNKPLLLKETTEWLFTEHRRGK